MMERTKIISTIIRIGTVLLSTILSFAVIPPVLTPDQYSVLSWRNIFVLCAGVIWILSYRRITDVSLAKRWSAMLFVFFLVLVVTYEFVYQKYSIFCYDKLRVVISNAPMTPIGALKYEYWLKHSQDPMKDLLASNQCSSLAIWDYSNIALPYYGIIALYFIIILVLISLFIILSELVFLNKSIKSSSDV